MGTSCRKYALGKEGKNCHRCQRKDEEEGFQSREGKKISDFEIYTQIK